MHREERAATAQLVVTLKKHLGHTGSKSEVTVDLERRMRTSNMLGYNRPSGYLRARCGRRAAVR